MDLTTTIRGSMMEGFLPKGWDLRTIDQLGGLSPQEATTRRVPLWTQWAKLQALAEGARLASTELWHR